MLHEHLKKNGRQGACIDITGILARILEKHGVWCVCIKGSCTIEFPASSNEEKTYFWSVDQGEFAAAHSWLFAPPFNIVDITIREQDYSGKKKNYIPKIVLDKKGSNSKAEIEDIISPSIVTNLRMRGIPTEELLELSATQMIDVQQYFPVKIVDGISGTKLKYCPVAIHASEEPLQGFKNMNFRGKTPYKLYTKYFKGKLGTINA